MISAETIAENQLIHFIHQIFNPDPNSPDDKCWDLRIKSINHGQDFLFSLEQSTEEDTSMFSSEKAIKIVQTKYFDRTK